MASSDSPPRKMKTTEKSLRVLETVYRLNGATGSEVAAELGMNRSSAHTHLVTLADNGYLVKIDGQYKLGMWLLRLGTAARNRDPAYKEVQVITEKLAEETKERSQFTIEECGEGIYLFESMGSQGVSTGPQIGGRVPLHATASGKTILANIDDERLQKLLEHMELDQFTPQTTTDIRELLDELQTIRENGFAINEQEDVTGINAVAAPVKGSDGRVLGAVSVAGPSHRLPRDRLENEVADLMLGYTNELELRLGGESADIGFPYDKP